MADKPKSAPEELKVLGAVARNARYVVQNHHFIKTNRIHALTNKRYELERQFKRTIKALDAEIERTRQHPPAKQYDPAKEGYFWD